MERKRGRVTIYYASGREEGFGWTLGIDLVEKTLNFIGHFTLDSLERRERAKVRSRDRRFFSMRLPKEMLDKYEIDHDWNNGAVVTLKTPKEHRNSNKGKINLRDWKEDEEWL